MHNIERIISHIGETEFLESSEISGNNGKGKKRKSKKIDRFDPPVAMFNRCFYIQGISKKTTK
jgi:hypothetical protein